VILGGGLPRGALEYGGETFGTLALERVRYCAYVARRPGLPLLVNGGVIFAGTPEAEVMRGALESEFGVPVGRAETRSRDPHQNAANFDEREQDRRGLSATHAAGEQPVASVH
jgi:hypothetical protein